MYLAVLVTQDQLPYKAELIYVQARSCPSVPEQLLVEANRVRTGPQITTKSRAKKAILCPAAATTH